MGLPPPKLRDLMLFIEKTDSQAVEKLEMWEIGVPPKNGLYWSIVLSCLLSNKEEDLSNVLNNVSSFGKETTKNRKKGQLSSNFIDFKVIKKRIKNFNPFKNRHVFFYDEEIIKVFRTFKLKLNQHANMLKSGGSEWNDEIKLNAAADMLDCKIDVYFPDESKRKFISYPAQCNKNSASKITLFQYEDQEHGCRKGNMNIFYFAMATDYAYTLKISALSFILEKAKFSKENAMSIKRLMFHPGAHGKSFLPTVLQSDYFYLMPGFYRSPYIPLKLSEAGFETNPIATNAESPSAFLLSFTKADTKYIRILYDYASNCRYLFDRSVRDANETILDSLKLIHDIFETDRISIKKLDFDSNTKERALRVQREFSRYNEYQQNIATTIKGLKHELGENPSKTEVLLIRKKVIKCVLDSYSNFFYYSSLNSANLCEVYYSYLSFTEYYENIDTFTCLSFFDNIHLLKKLYQFKDENIYANIESIFFLLMVSSKFFPKFNHATKCNCEHDETDCERNKNVLRFVPFLYREKLKTEIVDFQSKFMQYEESPFPQDKIKEDNLRSSLASLPQVRDELLISRIQKYLKEAVNVSFEEDGIKGIFVIERTLQVLGESIKPQSTEGCVVSCMLGSRLPTQINRKLINIRDNLSHYRDKLVQGRLSSKKDKEFFKDLQNELKMIMQSFEIVAFTQYLRLEEFLMENCQKQLEEKNLDPNIIEKFSSEYRKRLHNRKIGYKRFHDQCKTLSLEMINNLRDYLNKNQGIKGEGNKNEIGNINAKLKSIEYIFLLMGKLINEDVFHPLLSEVQTYRLKYENKMKIHNLRYDIECFRKRYIDTITENFSEAITENTLSRYPKIETFLDFLKKGTSNKSNTKTIISVIKLSYDEAMNAREELINYINLGSFNLGEKEELLLNKLIISQENYKKLKKNFEETNIKPALKELNKKWITKDCLVDKILKIFDDNSAEEGDAKSLLIKIAYQRYLPSSIYSSAKFDDHVCDDIVDILTKKTQFLLSRIQDIKAILIDENEEIKQAWNWGRSKSMKYHMKFLMRQRFLREMSVRASLEMALFDCLNILKRGEFTDMYEKLNNLFTGINLRNVLSHGHCVLETVGGLLDEDDLPSELINKMLDLIEDAEAVTTMQKLIPCSGTLGKETFKTWIENNQDEALSTKMKIIKRSPRWDRYLFLLPLM